MTSKEFYFFFWIFHNFKKVFVYYFKNFMNFFFTPGRILSFIICPALVSITTIIFIFCSIDIYSGSDKFHNVAGVISIWVYYFYGLFLFIAYSHNTYGMNELFRSSTNTCISVLLIITYPIFFLFWLPVIVVRILCYRTSPKDLWQNLFEGTCWDFYKLAEWYFIDTPTKIGRVISIGIPYGIYFLIYCLIAIFLTPLWYFITSPIGLGSVGICLHVSVQFPDTLDGDFQDRCARTYRIGFFIETIMHSLLQCIIAILYLVYEGNDWWAILSVIIDGIVFLGCIIPSIYLLFCQTNNMYF